MYQIYTLSTLNVYKAICQLHLSKAGKKKYFVEIVNTVKTVNSVEFENRINGIKSSKDKNWVHFFIVAYSGLSR